MAHWQLDEKESKLERIIMFTLVGKYRKIMINDNLVENYRKEIVFLLEKFGYSR